MASLVIRVLVEVCTVPVLLVNYRFISQNMIRIIKISNLNQGSDDVKFLTKFKTQSDMEFLFQTDKLTNGIYDNDSSGDICIAICVLEFD